MLISYDTLHDALESHIGVFRRDKNVSTEALMWLCDSLIADLTKWKLGNRTYPDLVVPVIASKSFNDIPVSSTSTSPAKVEKQALNISTDMRKFGVLKILSTKPGSTTLDEVMSGLGSMGLGDKRTTVVSLLRRMRKDAGLIASPHEGLYELTDDGRAAFERLSQSLTPPTAK